MNQLNCVQTASPQHTPPLSAHTDVLDLLTSTIEPPEPNILKSEVSAEQKYGTVQGDQAQSLTHTLLESSEASKQSNNESEKNIADLILTESTQKEKDDDCKLLIHSNIAQPANLSLAVKPLGDLTVTLDCIKPGRPTFF